jgi:hypothetical protein
MKTILLPFFIFFSSICFGQSDNYQLMRDELKVINSVYQSQYNDNSSIKSVMDKTMKYRLDPKLGKNEYVTKDEQKGLRDFEELQTTRDLETIDVYKKYQPQSYVDLMYDYNIKRKELRVQLMNKKITWRQFSDGLEDLIIRNRAKESEYREKKDVDSKMS